MQRFHAGSSLLLGKRFGELGSFLGHAWQSGRSEIIDDDGS